MRVAIIGAGFTGLAAAKKLSEKGYEVTVFEAAGVPGGLASGFKNPGWKWPLEKHYHHIFESDWAIRNFASELKHKIVFKEVTTSTLTPHGIFPLDSPKALLTFPGLDLVAKLRVAAVLAFLKITPFWKPLEAVSTKAFLRMWMGETAWKVLWQDLFKKKFGKYYSGVPASWFWARIKKRSKKLGYPRGGFEGLANKAVRYLKKEGAILYFDTSINRIARKDNKVSLKTASGEEFIFDRVICTLPSPLFERIMVGLPSGYRNKLIGLKGIGAVTLVLSLKENLLKNVYWLNVGEGNYPFLAVVEHTNLIRSNNYGDDKIVYIGNYLDTGHKYFGLNAKELLEEFMPYLKFVNPDFKVSWIKKVDVFKTGFAQPIITLNYSKKLPALKTPIEGVYLANIQQVYPWDRGTNYAVELGEKVAQLIE